MAVMGETEDEAALGGGVGEAEGVGFVHSCGHGEWVLPMVRAPKCALCMVLGGWALVFPSFWAAVTLPLISAVRDVSGWRAGALLVCVPPEREEDPGV